MVRQGRHEGGARPACSERRRATRPANGMWKGSGNTNRLGGDLGDEVDNVRVVEGNLSNIIVTSLVVFVVSCASSWSHSSDTTRVHTPATNLVSVVSVDDNLGLAGAVDAEELSERPGVDAVDTRDAVLVEVRGERALGIPVAVVSRWQTACGMRAGMSATNQRPGAE